MGTNLQGYHLLWPDLPTFSQLQFTAPFRNLQSRYEVTRLKEEGLAGFSIIQSTINRMKPGEKEVNTLERSFVFLFLKIPNPLSLAATNGVSVDFPSFSY